MSKSKSYKSPLEKICNKYDIRIETGKGVIIAQHELDHLISKKDSVEIKFNFDDKAFKTITNLAKRLNVSIYAVIYYALQCSIKEGKNPKSHYEVKL